MWSGAALATIALAAVAGLLLPAIGFTMARQKKTALDRAARHPFRRRVMTIIQDRPGIRIGELWKMLGANRGTTRYHLKFMEHVGAIEVVHGEKSVRLFQSGADETALVRMAILLRGRILEVVDEVVRRPGSIQRQITETLCISRKVLCHYVKLLRSSGLLKETREAKTRRYFPTPALEKSLAALRNRADGAVPPTHETTSERGPLS